MAKIDVTTIEGYEEMTAEEKLAALESFEYDDGSAEISKYKAAFDKASKETADTKKQLRQVQEKAKEGTSESEQQLKELQAQIENLTRSKTISEYTAQFTALGYSAELSAETAKAIVDGDMETVFANQKSFLTDHDKALKAQILASTPKPDKGGTGNGAPAMTREKFKNLNLAERNKFALEHPEEYQKLYGG
jgi:hypothetical protein